VEKFGVQESVVLVCCGTPELLGACLSGRLLNVTTILLRRVANMVKWAK
jgi:hypothetical protein